MRLKTLFSDDSYDFYTLDTKYVVTEDVVSNTFPNVHKRRRKQANEFLQSRLWNRSKAISYTVTKNGVQFFCMKTAQYSKKHDKLPSTRNEVALFSRLFISCQTMEGNLEHFFRSRTPSLSSLFIRTR